MDKQKFNEWVQRLNTLRFRMSDSEVDFWEGVMSFEADEEAWGREGGNGYFYFEEALHVAGVKSPHEYRKFKGCVKKLGGVAAVRSIGFAAAKELLDVPDDAPSRVDADKLAVRAVFDSLVQFCEKHGKEPSGQTAASKVRQYYEAPVKSKVEEPENAFDRLKRENSELRAENVFLKKENASLRKQLASAGVIAKAQGPLAGRKTQRKRSGSTVQAQA